MANRLSQDTKSEFRRKYRGGVRWDQKQRKKEGNVEKGNEKQKINNKFFP